MKLIIITGASRGIGKAIAETADRLFKESVCFALFARNEKKLREVADSLNNKSEILAVDFSCPETVEEKAEQLFSTLNPENYNSLILINNAGVLEPVAPADKTTASELQNAFNINIVSAMALTSKFLSWSAVSDSRKFVLNVSSGAASFTIHSWSAYCSTKAAMNMFTRVLVDEKHKNLNAFAIAPGIIDTDMQSVIRGKSESEFPLVNDFINYQSEGHLKSPEQCSQEILGIIQHPEQFDTIVKF